MSDRGIIRKKKTRYGVVYRVYKIMSDGTEKLKGTFPTNYKAQRYLKGFKSNN